MNLLDEADAIEQLADFEALLIMRERTPITKNLIDNLNDLKFVITSGLRNRSIDLEAAKKKNNSLWNRYKHKPYTRVNLGINSWFS